MQDIEGSCQLLVKVMSGSIELGTDSILSLRRGGGKGHITAIALLNNLSYVPKQFSTPATGWFRGVGIKNLWEKEDLKELLPPLGLYL